MKPPKLRSTERGEGQVGSIVMLIILIALAVAAVDIGPVYWDNYQWEDALKEIAGRFPPNKDGDTRAQAALKKAIEQAGLAAYLQPENCSVTSGGGIGGLRT